MRPVSRWTPSEDPQPNKGERALPSRRTKREGCLHSRARARWKVYPEWAVNHRPKPEGMDHKEEEVWEKRKIFFIIFPGTLKIFWHPKDLRLWRAPFGDVRHPAAGARPKSRLSLQPPAHFRIWPTKTHSSPQPSARGGHPGCSEASFAALLRHKYPRCAGNSALRQAQPCSSPCI